MTFGLMLLVCKVEIEIKFSTLKLKSREVASYISNHPLNNQELRDYNLKTLPALNLYILKYCLQRNKRIN
jgi:hypothetical protein